ncbi:MAG: hypothetical protein CVV27_07710 [Candidatus Melainabacteria bacterium HGW-Melainabacteria-1]|nr:MAG: hypothetical protein CVV27_07710 [Candidatus Melainabacteria bacterium HGW-Melainabacteria-1]
MSHWLFLPLDGRPCNARFPVELAALAGQQVLCPPVEALGDALRPARRDRLESWIESRLPGAQGLFLSLDTWLYGNLVASRKNQEGLKALQLRLEQLRALKARHPDLTIHGFATLLRLSNSNDDTEERPYWKQYGTQIYRLSWLEHYLKSRVDNELQAEYEALCESIPADLLLDYRQLRSRNLALLEAVLALQNDGILDTLLIGCDDGGSYGWTIQERQSLEESIAVQGLATRSLIYPGADELACVLLARVLITERPRIQVKWTWPEARQLITRYEGIPLNETLRYQAQAVGVELLDDLEIDDVTDASPACDGLLWVHNFPAGEQIDQFLDRESRQTVSTEHFTPLFSALTQSIPLALADVCYANGGDIQLLETLESEGLLLSLSAYAAWNTSGNTLGMLLAWFKLFLTGVNSHLQLRFLIERLADDGWYQGKLRQELCANYTDPVTLNSCIQAIAQLNDKLRAWREQLSDPPSCLQIQHLSFPWKRFFEVDLRVCTQSVAEEGLANQGSA